MEIGFTISWKEEFSLDKTKNTDDALASASIFNEVYEEIIS